jgi:ABC-2 type transport system permease protein
MNPRALFAMLAKDVRLYFANRFFAFITILGLVFYILIFFLLPKEVDETLELAFYPPVLPQALMDILSEEGVVLATYESEQALKDAVAAGDELVGIALDPDFGLKIAGGEKPRVHIYYSAALPEELQGIYKLLVEELSFMLTGRTLDVDAEQEIIGMDMAGQQVGVRQRMLPLFAMFVLIIETLGLASLITTEIETGTLRAVLTTPLRVEGMFLAKSVTGIGLAFVQAIIILAVTGGLQREPASILVILLVGCLLMTGVSFLIASLARDLMSVMGWGVMMLIILIIPGINILLPGLVSNWIRVIPTYYLVTPVYQVINLGAGWGEVSRSVLILLAYSLGLYALGIFAVRRRFS